MPCGIGDPERIQPSRDRHALREKSELVKDALGDHIFNKFVENKKIERDRCRIHVRQYEIKKYLPNM